MAIPDEEVAAVRAATDLVALVGEHVALKRQGRRFVGLCPFHTEKTASFSVNAEEGLYYCFGCQASGDAISFLRAKDQLDFVDAVERLADRAGIRLHRADAREGERHDRRRVLLEAIEAAVAWYHDRLLSHADAGRAREYLRSRGYDGEVVRAFRLGWAPDGWDNLCRALRLPDRVLADSGLGFVNRGGRQQDAFRSRLLFPIFDVAGRPVALGGRVLPGAGADQGPKYRNSPETPVYSKRRTLYGLNWAKAGVVKSGEVVLCEGYTDVIAFFQAGVPRAVATCGTSVAEEHVRLLKGFARRVVLAYDADAAGRAAAERLYDWERRHQLDITVADLPPGSDPAEVGQRDPSALRRAVEDSRPFLEIQVERALASADLSTAEGRARGAEAAVAVVAPHPGELVRDQYVMRVADRCRVDPDRLRGLVDRARRVRSSPGAPAGTEAARPHPGEASRDRSSGRSVRERGGPGGAGRARMGRGDGRAGMEALRLAVHRPGDVAALLDESLFTDAVQRDAFRALAGSSTLQEALRGVGDEVGDLLHRVAVEEPDAEPLEVVARLADLRATAALAALEAEARRDPDRASDLYGPTAWLRLTLDSVRQVPPAVDVLEGLVAWLSDWSEGDA